MPVTFVDQAGKTFVLPDGTYRADSVAPPPPPPPPQPPASGIDLAAWKWTSPTGPATKATEVLQPALMAYADANLVRNGDGSLTLKARVDGSRTSTNTKYPRSEFREMLPFKLGSSPQEAAWSNKADGTHTLTVSGSCDHLPDIKDQVTVAQIHDDSDDILGILFDGGKFSKTGKPQLVLRWKGSDDFTKPIAAVSLGQRFNIRVVATKGKVEVFSDGVLTHSKTFSGSGMYFKAGAYVQSNVADWKELPTAYGQVTLFAMEAKHTA